MEESVEKILRPSLHEASSGRLKISALVFHLGPDIQALLYGGLVHLGAAALASPQEDGCLSAPGHKDRLPALEMARALSAALGCRAAVSCGIHFEGISAAEIEECLELCRGLTARIIASASGGSKSGQASGAD